ASTSPIRRFGSQRERSISPSRPRSRAGAMASSAGSTRRTPRRTSCRIRGRSPAGTNPEGPTCGSIRGSRPAASCPSTTTPSWRSSSCGAAIARSRYGGCTAPSRNSRWKASRRPSRSTARRWPIRPSFRATTTPRSPHRSSWREPATSVKSVSALAPAGSPMSAGATIGRVRNATYQIYRWRYECAFLVNLGFAGLPGLYRGIGGFAILTGATFGYILGFIAAAFLIGWALDARVRYRRPAYLALLLVAGIGLVYLLGAIWFYAWWTTGFGVIASR